MSRCYFLDGIVSAEMGRTALENLLPGEMTRILKNESGETMAYFDLVPEDNDPDLEAPYIRARIRGRHPHRDARVLAVLEALQSQIGGQIKNDR